MLEIHFRFFSVIYLLKPENSQIDKISMKTAAVPYSISKLMTWIEFYQ